MNDRNDSGPTSTRLSRRLFTQAGLASAGLVMGARALALADRDITAESPMGPFYPVDRPPENDADLTRLAGHARRASGNVIEVTGRVLDRRGNPVGDATLELWQANAAGRYAHPSDVSKAPLDPDFQGYASVRTDASGAWRIVTVKPGGYDSPIGHRPPHIHFDIRGQRYRTIAQMYFPEEASLNAVDQLYRSLGKGAGTSVALGDPRNPGRYSWDVVLMEG